MSLVSSEAPATTTRVAVAAAGVVTPLGDGTLTTALDLRCRSRFAARRDVEVMVPRGEEDLSDPWEEPEPEVVQPRQVHLAAILDPATPGGERPLALAAAALQRAVDLERWPKPLPLIVVLPAMEEPPDAREILDAIAYRAGIDYAPRRSRVLRGQGAAAIGAIEAAQRLLATDDKLTGVYVVAAASPATDPATSPPKSDPVLGEAGAALVLAPATTESPLATIVATALETHVESREAFATRAGTFDARKQEGASRRSLIAAKYGVEEEEGVSDEMLQWSSDGRALALLRAWQRGRDAGLADPDWLWGDHGERKSYRRGWQRVSSDLRLRPAHTSQVTRHLGVVGCAGPLLAIASAAEQARAGVAPASRAAVIAHDAGPGRAVLWLDLPPEPAPVPRRPPRKRLLGLLRKLRDDLAALRAHPGIDTDLAALDPLLYRVGSDRVAGSGRLAQYHQLQEALHETQRQAEGEGRDALEAVQRHLSRIDPVLHEIVRREPDAPPLARPVDRRTRATWGLSFVPGEALPWRREAIEEHLDVLARLALVRRVAPPRGLWSPGLVGFDRELRAELDAVAAHEVEAPGLIADALGAWAPTALATPEAAFVRALLLAGDEEPEGLRRALTALRSSPPVTWDAQGHALLLAPGPRVREALEDLASAGPEPLVALAVATLTGRGDARLEATGIASTHPSPRVRVAAAEALGLVPESKGAVNLLRSWLHEETDATVRAAIAEALTRRGDGGGLYYAREALRDATGTERRRLALLIAQGGEPADYDLLVEATLGTVDGDVLGWFGHVGAIELLIEVLERHPAPPEPPPVEDVARIAARALHRLTGALAPEAPLPDERPDAGNADPGAWRKWYLERRSRLDPSRRYRLGEPYALAALLDELSGPRPADVRGDAWRELVLAGGAAELPSLHGWHDGQLKALAVLRERAVTKTITPGGWPRSWRMSLAPRDHDRTEGSCDTEEDA